MTNEDRDEAGRFYKGHKSAGPGRPKGSRNKLSEAFFDDFYADWKEHGKTAIQDARLKDPVAYMKTAASLMPKELAVKSVEDSLTDEQLAEYIDALDGELERRAREVGGDSGPPEGAPVH